MPGNKNKREELERRHRELTEKNKAKDDALATAKNKGKADTAAAKGKADTTTPSRMPGMRTIMGFMFLIGAVVSMVAQRQGISNEATKSLDAVIKNGSINPDWKFEKLARALTDDMSPAQYTPKQAQGQLPGYQSQGRAQTESQQRLEDPNSAKSQQDAAIRKRRGF